MSSLLRRAPSVGHLHTAVVIGTTEDECTVATADGTDAVAYAQPFPAPRVERVSPGHLVAVLTTPAGDGSVVWRWFDAVVVSDDGALATLWEPAHGRFQARKRHPHRLCVPGTRAYASAGLPGAEWWVAGAVVAPMDPAAVDLAELDAFLTEIGL